mmetsp:Transcript_26287/g.29089  ORF Transcript_26287/g.29089 Transcript_26287/m.29089 type:complete len:175 (-) Transcript_26287:17-541(-)
MSNSILKKNRTVIDVKDLKQDYQIHDVSIKLTKNLKRKGKLRSEYRIDIDCLESDNSCDMSKVLANSYQAQILQNNLIEIKIPVFFLQSEKYGRTFGKENIGFTAEKTILLRFDENDILSNDIHSADSKNGIIKPNFITVVSKMTNSENIKSAMNHIRVSWLVNTIEDTEPSLI